MIDNLWKSKNRKENFVILWAVLILSGIELFAKIMRFLTRYPPFSLFWKDRFFHYQNSDIYTSRKKINELVGDIAGNFDVRIVDRDQYFLTLIGRFSNLNSASRKKEKYERIADKLGKEDMLLRAGDKGMVKVLIKH